LKQDAANWKEKGRITIDADWKDEVDNLKEEASLPLMLT